MRQLGLKLWSTNRQYIEEALSLYDQGLYQYIELFAEPGSFDECIDWWKQLQIPFVIHAPHFIKGLNFGRPEAERQNAVLVEETKRFADALNASLIIFHPGIDGYLAESIRQIQKFYDSRMAIENKPYRVTVNDLICIGNSPEEIQKIVEVCSVKFCLDIGHAICSANAHSINPFLFIKKFLALKPAMFHLTDGDFKGIYDQHLHLGFGTYLLQDLIKLIPPNVLLTLETEKLFKDSLADFKDDLRFFRGVESGCL